MKKALLLLLSLGLLGGLSACGNEKPKDEDIPSEDPIDPSIHATSMTVDPNQPFYLKVNETKKLKATLTPSPTNDDEKTFTWSVRGGDDIVEFVAPSTTNQIDIIGKKVGNATVTVVNDYNRSFYKTFDVKVIDIDPAKTYLWEYDSEDRKQFGYDSKTQDLGVKSGTAILGGMEWSFERDKLTALQSLNGGIGFGKGKEPETHVHLETENQRPVKSIVIETGSAEGLADITVKIGNQEVIKDKAPNFEDRHCSTLEATNLSDLTGNISIDFVTPEYDSSKKDDPEYKAPGAVVLKSIWISYGEETFDFVTEKTYDFKAMYDNQDSDFYKALGSGCKEVTLEDENFIIKFANVGKEDKIPGYARTNSAIEVFEKKTTEVIKQVQFTYQCGTTTTSYDIYSSIVGGAPYDKFVAGGNATGVFGTIYRDHVNAIALTTAKNNYVGLKSLTIKTVAGTHAVIDSVKLDEGAKPDTVSYFEGQKFDPTGLGNATITFDQSSGTIAPVLYPTENLVFYDGESYKDPADHSGATEILKEGTTNVVAVLCGKEISVDIDAVQVKTTTFEKIKDISDLTTGSYLLTAPSKKAILQGTANSSSDFGASKCISYLSECEFGDEISINYLFESEMISITKVDGIYHIANATGKNFGMTAGHGTSLSDAPKYKDWTITIDASGLVTMSLIDDAAVPYYYGYGTSTFKFDTENKNNIALYKISE